MARLDAGDVEDLVYECQQVLPGSLLEEQAAELGLDFSRRAPHLVSGTRQMPAETMERLSRLSAVLFRALNSPLRERFFLAAGRRPGGPRQILGDIMAGLAADPATSACRVLGDGVIDDIYWNRDIYRDIPSAWLGDFLDA